MKKLFSKIKAFFGLFGKDVDMINGPIFGRLWVYIIPLMLSGILQLLYNAADVVVVGNYAADSQTALAAVGSTGSITSLVISLFLGLSVGTNVVVSRYLGANDDENVSETVHTSILTSIIAGAVLTVIGVTFAGTFLSWMGTPETVIAQSTLYMQIYFCGMIFSMLYNFGSAILRAKGDTRFPFIVLVISGLVNVVLNLVTVIVFHLDVAGVALATTSSQVVSAILVTIRLCKVKDCCRLELKKLRISKHKLIKIAKIGLPAGAQSMLFSISNVLLQTAVNSLGDTAMAGNTSASNIDGFIYIACNSVYHAAIAFVGQNYGARKYARIRVVCFQCIIIVCIIGLVLGSFAFVFRDSLLCLYAPGEENAAVRSYGNLRLEVTALTYFICGLMDVATGLLRGLCYSVTAMLITVVGTCVLRICWIYFLFYRVEALHNMFWLYMTYPISWIVTFAAELTAFLILFHKKCRKHGINPKELKNMPI